MVPAGAPPKSRRSSAAEPRTERGADTIPAHSVGSLGGFTDGGGVERKARLPGEQGGLISVCRSNDNALVEGKNAHVVRRHLGHEHIPACFADDVDAFARGHLSTFVNFHRPSLYATE